LFALKILGFASTFCQAILRPQGNPNPALRIPEDELRDEEMHRFIADLKKISKVPV
jgi:hypothetical protein